jgi:hypothetical protein
MVSLCIEKQAGLKEVSIEGTNFTTHLHTIIISNSLVNVKYNQYYLH